LTSQGTPAVRYRFRSEDQEAERFRERPEKKPRLSPPVDQAAPSRNDVPGLAIAAAVTGQVRRPGGLMSKKGRYRGQA
jgi:hypothetical protein